MDDFHQERRVGVDRRFTNARLIREHGTKTVSVSRVSEVSEGRFMMFNLALLLIMTLLVFLLLAFD